MALNIFCALYYTRKYNIGKVHCGQIIFKWHGFYCTRVLPDGCPIVYIAKAFLIEAEIIH